jgi:hypothetical protein
VVAVEIQTISIRRSIARLFNVPSVDSIWGGISALSLPVYMLSYGIGDGWELKLMLQSFTG